MNEQTPMSPDEIREATDRAVAANENATPRPLTKPKAAKAEAKAK